MKPESPLPGQGASRPDDFRSHRDPVAGRGLKRRVGPKLDFVHRREAVLARDPRRDDEELALDRHPDLVGLDDGLFEPDADRLGGLDAPDGLGLGDADADGLGPGLPATAATRDEDRERERRPAPSSAARLTRPSRVACR